MLVFGARSAAPWARRGAALAAGARAVRRMSSAGAGKSSRLSKFHTLDIPGRVAKLEQAGFLTTETVLMRSATGSVRRMTYRNPVN